MATGRISFTKRVRKDFIARSLYLAWMDFSRLKSFLWRFLVMKCKSEGANWLSLVLGAVRGGITH